MKQQHYIENTPAMSKKKLIFQLCGLVLCVLGIYFALKDQDLWLLKQIHFKDIFICSLMIVFSYCCSGLQYYIILRKMNCNLAPKDIFLFPFVQSFWGLVIPFLGTNLFAVYYLKKRYSFRIEQSVTMVLFLYLFNVIFASITGMLYALKYLGGANPLFIFSALAFFLPLILKLFQLYFKTKEKLPFIPQNLNNILKMFCNDMDQLWTDKKNIAALVSCQVVRQICCSIIFLIFANALGHNVSFLWGYLLAVSQELSVIIKLTPGNLGVTEMISGVISMITGLEVSIGVIVSLLNSLLNIIWVLLIGGLASIFLFRRSMSAITEQDK